MFCLIRALGSCVKALQLLSHFWTKLCNISSAVFCYITVVKICSQSFALHLLYFSYCLNLSLQIAYLLKYISICPSNRLQQAVCYFSLFVGACRTCVSWVTLLLAVIVGGSSPICSISGIDLTKIVFPSGSKYCQRYLGIDPLIFSYYW